MYKIRLGFILGVIALVVPFSAYANTSMTADNMMVLKTSCGTLPLSLALANDSKTCYIVRQMDTSTGNLKIFYAETDALSSNDVAYFENILGGLQIAQSVSLSVVVGDPVTYTPGRTYEEYYYKILSTGTTTAIITTTSTGSIATGITTPSTSSSTQTIPFTDTMNQITQDNTTITEPTADQQDNEDMVEDPAYFTTEQGEIELGEIRSYDANGKLVLLKLSNHTQISQKEYNILKNKTISDIAKKLGVDRNKERSALAEGYGLENYKGTREQNMQIKKALLAQLVVVKTDVEIKTEEINAQMNQFISAIEPIQVTAKEYNQLKNSTLFDIMKKAGIDRTKNRKTLAAAFRIQNYTGTREQNMHIRKKILAMFVVK